MMFIVFQIGGPQSRGDMVFDLKQGTNFVHSLIFTMNPKRPLSSDSSSSSNNKRRKQSQPRKCVGVAKYAHDDLYLPRYHKRSADVNGASAGSAGSSRDHTDENKRSTEKNSVEFAAVEEMELTLQNLPAALTTQLERIRTRRCRQAEFLLGYHFDTGADEVPPATKQAIYWYERAARRGHVVAQLNLGVLYETGHRGRRAADYSAAVQWYFSAAQHGHAGARFNLGRLFWSGKGLPRNYDASFRFFKRAGKQGHSMALTNVGAMFMSGNGVRQDPVAARRWSRLAADKRNATAHQNLGVMHEQGLGGPVDVVKAAEHFRHAIDPSMEYVVSQQLSNDMRQSSDPLFFT
jgi:TPR repeat protein